MRSALILAGLLLLGSLYLAPRARAQAGPAPVAPAPPTTKAGVTPGVPLPTGLGFFANPDNYHRLTLGVQAGLGVSEDSETFGYDNLAVNSKWKLGTNALGRHLHALIGFSDWRAPAYRKVFSKAAIDPLPNQDRFGAQSANAASLGLAFAAGREPWQPDSAQNQHLLALRVLYGPGNYLPTYLLNTPAYAAGADLATHRTALEEEEARLLAAEQTLLRQQTANPTNSLFIPIALAPTERASLMAALQANGKTADQAKAAVDSWEKGSITKAELALLDALHISPAITDQLAFTRPSPPLLTRWQAQETNDFIRYQRAAIREFSYSLGALTRFASFAEKTDLQAVDAYATVARGTASYDVAAAAHYLHYLDNSLPHYAATVAAGVYADLSDTNIFPILGLTAGYGYYAFRELHDVIAEAPALAESQRPHTQRLDIILSISGAPDKSNATGAGLGIRYSRIAPSLLPAYNAFSLVFSSNFSLVK